MKMRFPILVKDGPLCHCHAFKRYGKTCIIDYFAMKLRRSSHVLRLSLLDLGYLFMIFLRVGVYNNNNNYCVFEFLLYCMAGLDIELSEPQSQ